MARRISKGASEDNHEASASFSEKKTQEESALLDIGAARNAVLSQIEIDKETAAEMEERIQFLRAEISVLEARKLAVESDTESNKREFGLSVKVLDEAKRRSSEFKDSAEAEKTHLREEIKELNRNLAEKKASSQKVIEEINAAVLQKNRELADLNSKIESFNVEIVRLNGEIESKKSEVLHIQSNIEELRAIARQTSTDEDHLKYLLAQIDARDEELKNLQSEVSSLQERKQEVEADIKSKLIGLDEKIRMSNLVASMADSKTERLKQMTDKATALGIIKEKIT